MRVVEYFHGLAEGEELETNILSQDFARLRANSHFEGLLSSRMSKSRLITPSTETPGGKSLLIRIVHHQPIRAFFRSNDLPDAILRSNAGQLFTPAYTQASGVLTRTLIAKAATEPVSNSQWKAAIS